MRPTLPRAFGRKALLVLMFGCHHAEMPVAPGDPIPPEPAVAIDTMDKECDALIAAIERYGACPNAEDEDREWTQALVKAARESFEAGKKGNPDAQAQHVIAHACHRAAESMTHATERCNAGKRPPPNY